MNNFLVVNSKKKIMFQYKKVIFLSFLLIINLVKSQTPEEIQEKIKLWKTTE